VINRVRIVEHGIVLLDFSGIAEPDKELHHSAEAKRIIATRWSGCPPSPASSSGP